MIQSVERLIAIIRNELRALKASSPLSIGALKFPEQTPTDTYNGTVDTTTQNYVAARIAATFTRTDGETSTPLVDFAFDYALNPNYVGAMVTQNVTITGSDPNAPSEIYIRGYVASTTATSVTYYIDILNAVVGLALSNVALSLNVQAISTVNGALGLERLI